VVNAFSYMTMKTYYKAKVKVVSAFDRLKNYRAPGADGIPEGLLKFAIVPVGRALHFLFVEILKYVIVPIDC